MMVLTLNMKGDILKVSKMNDLQVFKNEQFGQVRVIEQDGEPWFMLSDACGVLDIKNPSDAKTRLKKDGVVTTEVIDNLGRTQQSSFINESNLYKLVFQSRKPEAEMFVEWVTHDVIPTIRKHGAYIKYY